ncbi:MAG TPA: HAMP domain-containing sensor histidine kinase [Longimicrobiaceae bacterium]|nr:HAMP domain-containing sensor histidine kinase [Longimicrobiaceae bacterium]
MHLAQLGLLYNPDARTLLLLNVLAVLTVGGVGLTALVILYHRRERRREERRMVAVGSAMSRILHQMKNPLQTVMLQADLLQDPAIGQDAEARQGACQAILSESERLASMLGELSVWAAGSRRSLALEPMSLHTLVRQLAEEHRRESENRGIDLRVGPIEEATVLADSFYLRQAVENLLRNACEAVAEQPNARVALSLQRTPSTALVRVSDNGPGIPPKQMKEIFLPFVTTKMKGMGLGLSICKEIIEGHSGRLEVRSRAGSGAEFRVQMPLLREAKQESGVGSAGAAPVAGRMLNNG